MLFNVIKITLAEFKELGYDKLFNGIFHYLYKVHNAISEESYLAKNAGAGGRITTHLIFVSALEDELFQHYRGLLCAVAFLYGRALNLVVQNYVARFPGPYPS